MKYLLDTDVIISHINGKIPLEFDHVQAAGISVITLGEVIYGFEKSKNIKKSQQFKDLVSELSIEIFSLTESVIQTFVQLKLLLEKQGQKLDEFDLLIAATALEHDLTLITANKSHFSRIPHLKLA